MKVKVKSLLQDPLRVSMIHVCLHRRIRKITNERQIIILWKFESHELMLSVDQSQKYIH